ncbi:MAG: hypothetical protein ABIQ31_23930 [Ferruginibacter sp.]
MENTTSSTDIGQEGQDRQELKETLDEGKNNAAVKDALKKEKQPQTPEDLSPLHNNREIGTSGGDQRASESEPNEPGQ